MSTLYETYLRDSTTGKRTSLVEGIVSYKITFRANKPVKFQIDGSGLTACPISAGTGIAVFRNNAILFCGYAEEIKDEYDAESHIYDWEITGQSDIARLAQRLVFPDPSSATPDPDGSWSSTDQLSAILLDAIDLNAGSQALSDRQLAGMVVPTQTPVGDSMTIESKLDSLLKLIQDKLTDTDYCLKETWDMSSGNWNVTISAPTDVSSSVIFSVDNGTISQWERTVEAPKANWILVTGCKDENDATMSCIVYDSTSISSWGRIEAVVSRSDIKRDEDNSETWQSVADRLEAAAYEELEKNTATFGYKLTVTEMARNVYPADYGIGDIVAVRIGSDQLTAKVEEIKITYSKGVENIVPSVGTMQKGELESVFSELGTLKDQIKVLQKSA